MAIADDDQVVELNLTITKGDLKWAIQALEKLGRSLEEMSTKQAAIGPAYFETSMGTSKNARHVGSLASKLRRQLQEQV